jgi:hypothetical protein
MTEIHPWMSGAVLHRADDDAHSKPTSQKPVSPIPARLVVGSAADSGEQRLGLASILLFGKAYAVQPRTKKSNLRRGASSAENA